MTLAARPSQILVPSLRRYQTGDSLDFAVPVVWTVPEVLSAAECRAMIGRIEEMGPKAAPINTSEGMIMRPEVRNNTRVMFDDRELAARLFSRIKESIPSEMNGGMVPVGANERFRGYRYQSGECFRPHYDGCFRRDEREESLLTLMVYLNDDFTGGVTEFLDFELTVQPEPGLALFFQHCVLHEGCAVESGAKYVLRTDVMYREASA